MRKIDPQTLKKTIVKLCQAVGLPAEDAGIVGNALINANLRGIDTHGVRTLPNYIKRFEVGSLNKTPHISIDKETKITAAVNGDNGLGHIVGEKSMQLAIKKAKEHGIGLVTARNSNHFGAAAYFSMQALEEGFIGIAMTNATARLAPTGGITPCYGNNPWSVAIPTGDMPLVADMAMSVVANSHIIIAKEKGTSIPEGWALTKEGEATQDPNSAVLLLPFGGYKGYAIAAIVEVLTGILSGASFGKKVGLYNSMDEGQDVGHFFAALDIESFMPLSEFKERMNEFINEIKESALAKGTEKIFLPGEKEYLQYQKRSQEGLMLDEDDLKKIEELCNSYGLPNTSKRRETR